MYVTSYKTNNSYTIYVIHDTGDDEQRDYCCNRKLKPSLEWKHGAKVFHNFYGIGTICGITNNQVIVHFSNSKLSKPFKNIQVIFEYNKKPSEIDSLRLCY